MPSAGLEELTDAERQELAAWFDARQSAKAERMNQYRASIGGQTLADLADLLADAAEPAPTVLPPASTGV